MNTKEIDAYWKIDEKMKTKLKCPGVISANNLVPFIWVVTHILMDNNVNIM